MASPPRSGSSTASTTPRPCTRRTSTTWPRWRGSAIARSSSRTTPRTPASGSAARATPRSRSPARPARASPPRSTSRANAAVRSKRRSGLSRGPALGVLEVSTIARGIVAADAGLKRAPAVLLHSRAVSGGKHLVMFEGGVAEVEEALGAARRIAGDLILDHVELPNADDQVWPMLGAPYTAHDWSPDPAAEAVAIIETSTVCAAIRAADAACKVAFVVVRDTRFAVDL